MKTKRIEVALPLEASNTASAREKSIRLGHPSTLASWRCACTEGAKNGPADIGFWVIAVLSAPTLAAVFEAG